MQNTIPPHILLLMGTLASSSAIADPRIDAVTSSVGEWFSKAEYSVGGGIAYGPRYAGSKDYKLSPFASIRALTPGGFYFDLLRGAGWQTSLGDRFSLAIGASYDPGRSDDGDGNKAGSDRLKGMGEVKGSALATTSVRFLITPATQLSLSAEQALSNRDRGLSWHVELGHSFTLSSTDSLGIAGAVHLGDRKFNQTYFGVTDDQSQSSRFKTYKADAGINSYSLMSNWTHKWTKNWSTDLSGGITQYAGDAADSPIVEKKNNFIGITSVNYTF